ncbi:hypothetical protein HK405_002679 [Cladochytrium tenue]|nr:hypothetical protein HK405_002679 [Cladochytrium tenue]
MKGLAGALATGRAADDPAAAVVTAAAVAPSASSSSSAHGATVALASRQGLPTSRSATTSAPGDIHGFSPIALDVAAAMKALPRGRGGSGAGASFPHGGNETSVAPAGAAPTVILFPRNFDDCIVMQPVPRAQAVATDDLHASSSGAGGGLLLESALAPLAMILASSSSSSGSPPSSPPPPARPELHHSAPSLQPMHPESFGSTATTTVAAVPSLVDLAPELVCPSAMLLVDDLGGAPAPVYGPRFATPAGTVALTAASSSSSLVTTAAVAARCPAYDFGNPIAQSSICWPPQPPATTAAGVPLSDVALGNSDRDLGHFSRMLAEARGDAPTTAVAPVAIAASHASGKGVGEANISAVGGRAVGNEPELFPYKNKAGRRPPNAFIL